MNTIPLKVKTPEQVAKEADGWIEWNGGECPTAKESVVEVRFRNGDIWNSEPAGSWFWGHALCPGDIIAYRLHNPEHTDCCGNPATCEQPCFHSAGRTTPGNPGVIASVPQSLAEVRSSDGWVTWGGGMMPATGMVEVRYRNGVTNTDDADSFLWDHRDYPDDIVAYRKISPAPQYDPRDVSFNPLDKQVGGNHYRDNSAPGFLREAISVMEQRGQQYDTEGGERSFEKAAKVFNAIAGTDYLSASDIALALLAVKLVRDQSREEPHRDSLLDAVAYASLYAEERLKEGA